MFDLFIGRQTERIITIIAITAVVIVVLNLFVKYKPAQALVGVLAFGGLVISAIFSLGHLNSYYSARGGVYGTISSIFERNQVEINESVDSIDFGFKNVVLMKNANGKYTASITSKKVLELNDNEDYFIYVNEQPCTTVSCESRDIYATYSYAFMDRENGEYLVMAEDMMTFYFAFYDNYSYLRIEVENGDMTHQLWNQYFNKNNFKVKIVKVPSTYYLTTQYKKITMKIDDTEYKTATIKSGSDYVLPAVKDTEDYHFNYWQDGNGNQITIVNNVTTDIIINANIKKIHKVSLYTGEYRYQILRVTDGESVELPVIDTQLGGKAYRNWIDENGSIITSLTNVSSDISIHADPLNIYTVKLMTDNTIWKTLSVVSGDSVTLPEINIVTNDYMFHGWLDSYGNSVDTIKNISSDMTFYAAKTNYYNVKLVYGNTTYKTIKVAAGDSITLPEINISTNNCIYNGWLDGDGNIITQLNNIQENMTIQASGINIYTVTYKVDTSTYKTEKVQEGGSLIEPTAPTKNGYSFLYWKDMSTGAVVYFSTYKVTKSTTLEAVFEYGYYYSSSAMSRTAGFGDNGSSITELRFANDELESYYTSKNYQELKISLKFGFMIHDYSVSDHGTDHYISSQSDTFVTFNIKPSGVTTQTITYSLIHKLADTTIEDTINVTFKYNIELHDNYIYIKVAPVTYNKLNGDTSSTHQYKITPMCYYINSINLYTV